MSTAYEAVADSRPRLRHDVLYTRTEDGVLLHNAHSGFRLTSPTAYRLVSLLVPHFNGRNRVADICRRLPDAQRVMIGELVRALYDREFARDVPEPESDPSTVLGEAVAKHFAAQIAYIDHYVGGAPQRFATFRETSVAIVGSDAIAQACAKGLVRNGAAAITVTRQVAEAIAGDLADAAAADCPVAVTPMPDEPGWAAIGDSAVVIVTGDDAPRMCLRLLTEGIPAGKRLLPGWTAGPRMLVGPAQGDGHEGCWCCAMLRLADNDDSGAAARVWQAAALPPGSRIAGERPEAPLQAMAGNLLAYEVFRLTTGALPAETDGSVIVQNMASLDVLIEPLLPHPLCTFCGVRAEPLDVDGLDLDPEPVERTDETAAAEQAVARLNGHQPLLSPHLGLVRRYDDERWDQTPVKVGTVELTAGGRRRTVSAFDIHHVAGARLRALRTAAVVATGHAAVTAVPQDGANRYGARELGLASGWTDAATTAWAGARSLRTGAPVAVPLAAVEPFGPANADHSVEPTAAGAGAGADAAEAIRAGLASALGYAALRRTIDGAAVQRVRLDTLGTAPELVFLTKSAANLGIAIDLLDLGGSPVPVLLARSWDPGRRRWWYALHADPVWGTAAAAALRDVVGQVQIHRQGGEAAVDTGDPALIDFDPGSLSVYAEADGRPGQVGRWSDVLADNRFEVLVAPVSGAELRRGGLVAVRVLLSGVDGR